MPPASPPDAGEEIPRTVEAMLKQYRRMLHALAFTFWRTGRNLAEIEDFRSVADVAAWKAFERYDPARGTSLKSWVYGKAQFALRDYRRVLVGSRCTRSDAHVRAGSVPLEDVQGVLAAPEHGDPAVALEIGFRAAELRAALDELLTERQADAVRLMYFGGLSQVEIARKYRRTSGNVSILHQRAIERLRRRFAA